MEIVKQGPSPEMILSRHQMPMKVMCSRQATVEGVHMAVKHIAGAIGLRMLKSQDKAVGFGAQLEDGFEGGASDVLFSPGLKLNDLLQEGGGRGGMIDIPDPLLNALEGIFEALAARTDGQESVQKAQNEGDVWETGFARPTGSATSHRC